MSRKSDTQWSQAGQKWGCRDPLRGVLRAWGQVPISAQPEPAALSPGPGFNFSHIVLTHFHSNQRGDFSCKQTTPLFCLKPTADFLPLISRRHSYPLLITSSHTMLSLSCELPPHQLPSDPAILGCSCLLGFLHIPQ